MQAWQFFMLICFVMLAPNLAASFRSWMALACFVTGLGFAAWQIFGKP